MVFFKKLDESKQERNFTTPSFKTILKIFDEKIDFFFSQLSEIFFQSSSFVIYKKQKETFFSSS